MKSRKIKKVTYVNLDNAATTPPLREVEKGVADYLAGYGSVHRGAGFKSKHSTTVYEKSRDVIRAFVHAPKDDYVIFSGNTTGAMNTAAHFFSQLKGKVMVSSVEHSSSWLPWIVAEGQKALGAKQVSLDEMEKNNELVQSLGRKQVLTYDVNDQFDFELSSIEKMLKENHVKVVVLTASSNLTGYCPDIESIGKLAHKYGAYFLVDACQFIQHHPIDMKKMGIDFLAASGHKFYAPYGGGFLIGPKAFLDQFLPYQIGGGNLPYITEKGEFLRYHNQLAHDPGTPNAVGAVAMMYAIQALSKIGLKNVERYEKKLSEKLYNALAKNDQINLYVSKKHLSTVIPFTVKGKDSVAVAETLNKKYGIGVRAGSFCVYHVVKKLLKIKDESKIINAVKAGDTSSVPKLIRASVAICNTEKDIDRFIEAINQITHKK